MVSLLTMWTALMMVIWAFSLLGFACPAETWLNQASLTVGFFPELNLASRRIPRGAWRGVEEIRDIPFDDLASMR